MMAEGWLKVEESFCQGLRVGICQLDFILIRGFVGDWVWGLDDWEDQFD